eukprot:1220959-Pyramimonas_sp.AAC.1
MCTPLFVSKSIDATRAAAQIWLFLLLVKGGGPRSKAQPLRVTRGSPRSTQQQAANGEPE